VFDDSTGLDEPFPISVLIYNVCHAGILAEKGDKSDRNEPQAVRKIFLRSNVVKMKLILVILIIYI